MTAPLIALRPYQRDAADAVHAAYRDNIRRPGLSMATGAGKTIVFAKVIEESNERALVIAHRKELIEQAAHKIGYVVDPHDIGIVMADRDQHDYPIVVASIQTIVNPKRLARLGNFGLVVIDEAHHGAAPSYIETLKALGVGQGLTTKALGVTATWDRADGLGLERVFDQIVYSVDIESLIASGHLADIAALTIETHLDMAGVGTSHGDYDMGEVERRIVASDYADTLAAAVRDHAPDRTCLVFAPNVLTAGVYRDALRAIGVRAELVSAKTPKPEREAILRDFNRGQIRAVVNVGVFTEGTDIPIVDCIDDETEVLTPAGWKGIDDDIDVVTALNATTGRLEDVSVDVRVEKEWSGDTVRMQSGSFNLHVTPNHRMLVGTGRRHQPMDFRPASTLPGLERFRLPISGEAVETTGVPLTDDELRFVAWFTTDGGWHRARNQICIAQSKAHEVERIRQLLTRLGFRNYESTTDNRKGFGGENAKPLVRFVVPLGVKGGAKGLGFSALMPYLEKDMSLSLMPMNARQFAVFWEELLHGDGNNDPRPTVADQLCISSAKLLSRLQALAVRSGYATNSSHRTLPSGRSMWWMAISSRPYLEIKPRDQRREAPSVWQEPLASPTRFWCLQNTHGTLVVRRQGRVAIVGNCIVMGRPTRSRALYQQMAGRGLRPYPGKQNALILDLIGVTGRLDLQTAASLIGREPKPGTKKIASFLEWIEEPELHDAPGFATIEVKGALGQTFKQRARAIDLIDRKRLAWTQVEINAFSLPAGDQGSVVIDGQADGTYRVIRFGRANDREELASGLDIGYAQGVAEQFVTTAEAQQLANPKANWRRPGVPATDRQLETLAKMRIRFEPGISKGQASELISAAIDKRNLRRYRQEAPVVERAS